MLVFGVFGCPTETHNSTSTGTRSEPSPETATPAELALIATKARIQANQDAQTARDEDYEAARKRTPAITTPFASFSKFNFDYSC